jgi:hypothetical protein
MKLKKVEDLIVTDIIYIPKYSKLGIVLLKQRDLCSRGWWYLTCLVDCSIKTINTYGLQEVMTARTKI